MKPFAGALLFLLASVTNLQAQAPFYQDKTIRIIVGNLAGDAYDLWARIFAQHMGKYIPGNPTFIVQNMTGAGGVVAANYVYTVAKPDGYPRHLRDVDVLRSAGLAPGSSVRLGEIHLDRQPGANRIYPD